MENGGGGVGREEVFDVPEVTGSHDEFSTVQSEAGSFSHVDSLKAAVKADNLDTFGTKMDCDHKTVDTTSPEEDPVSNSCQTNIESAHCEVQKFDIAMIPTVASTNDDVVNDLDKNHDHDSLLLNGNGTDFHPVEEEVNVGELESGRDQEVGREEAEVKDFENESPAIPEGISRDAADQIIPAETNGAVESSSVPQNMSTTEEELRALLDNAFDTKHEVAQSNGIEEQMPVEALAVLEAEATKAAQVTDLATESSSEQIAVESSIPNEMTEVPAAEASVDAIEITAVPEIAVSAEVVAEDAKDGKSKGFLGFIKEKTRSLSRDRKLPSEHAIAAEEHADATTDTSAEQKPKSAKKWNLFGKKSDGGIAPDGKDKLDEVAAEVVTKEGGDAVVEDVKQEEIGDQVPSDDKTDDKKKDKSAKKKGKKLFGSHAAEPKKAELTLDAEKKPSDENKEVISKSKTPKKSLFGGLKSKEKDQLQKEVETANPPEHDDGKETADHAEKDVVIVAVSTDGMQESVPVLEVTKPKWFQFGKKGDHADDKSTAAAGSSQEKDHKWHLFGKKTPHSKESVDTEKKEIGETAADSHAQNGDEKVLELPLPDTTAALNGDENKSEPAPTGVVETASDGSACVEVVTCVPDVIDVGNVEAAVGADMDTNETKLMEEVEGNNIELTISTESEQPLVVSESAGLSENEPLSSAVNETTEIKELVSDGEQVIADDGSISNEVNQQNSTLPDDVPAIISVDTHMPGTSTQESSKDELKQESNAEDLTAAPKKAKEHKKFSFGIKFGKKAKKPEHAVEGEVKPVEEQPVVASGEDAKEGSVEVEDVPPEGVVASEAAVSETVPVIVMEATDVEGTKESDEKAKDTITDEHKKESKKFHFGLKLGGHKKDSKPEEGEDVASDGAVKRRSWSPFGKKTAKKATDEGKGEGTVPTEDAVVVSPAIVTPEIVTLEASAVDIAASESVCIECIEPIYPDKNPAGESGQEKCADQPNELSAESVPNEPKEIQLSESEQIESRSSDQTESKPTESTETKPAEQPETQAVLLSSPTTELKQDDAKKHKGSGIHKIFTFGRRSRSYDVQLQEAAAATGTNTDENVAAAEHKLISTDNIPETNEQEDKKHDEVAVKQTEQPHSTRKMFSFSGLHFGKKKSKPAEDQTGDSAVPIDATVTVATTNETQPAPSEILKSEVHLSNESAPIELDLSADKLDAETATEALAIEGVNLSFQDDLSSIHEVVDKNGTIEKSVALENETEIKKTDVPVEEVVQESGVVESEAVPVSALNAEAPTEQPSSVEVATGLPTTDDATTTLKAESGKPATKKFSFGKIKFGKNKSKPVSEVHPDKPTEVHPANETVPEPNGTDEILPAQQGTDKTLVESAFTESPEKDTVAVSSVTNGHKDDVEEAAIHHLHKWNPFGKKADKRKDEHQAGDKKSINAKVHHTVDAPDETKDTADVNVNAKDTQVEVVDVVVASVNGEEIQPETIIEELDSKQKGKIGKKVASLNIGKGLFHKIFSPRNKGIDKTMKTTTDSVDDTDVIISYGVHDNGQLIAETSPKKSAIIKSKEFEELAQKTEELLEVGFPRPSPPATTNHIVVVAIDFGTTFSGYAFSFVNDPDSIHMMRKWEGGDPGVINQKTPTTILLNPDGEFHSFGFTARDFYHDLDAAEAGRWMYFDKFKMALHTGTDLNRETTISATNGCTYSALALFSHALRFFKDHALKELNSLGQTQFLPEDIRWVITVPAIWKASAKQFMRQAAYDAGIASSEYPDRLLIALEPEAASIYVRRLRRSQLVPEKVMNRPLSPNKNGTNGATDNMTTNAHSIVNINNDHSISEEIKPGTRYMVVDCGGGTVDITVHEMSSNKEFGYLKELYKATGGPYGSTGVDREFERLLTDIFGNDFIESFKTKRPAGWIDLMIAFESRKRAANPWRNSALNVSLPFSFIDFHKKVFGSQVEASIRKYNDKDIRWSMQGMLRLMPEAMTRLFQPTIDNIKNAIRHVITEPSVGGIEYLFLVGGFAESPVIQSSLRKEFENQVKIVIPQDVSLTILKGAVCFGMDPSVVVVRKSRHTFGVGVVNKFVRGVHPESKLMHADGMDFCVDIFDPFVKADQTVALGDNVVRRYATAKRDQTSTTIHVYCSESPDVKYVTDDGVRRCGTLELDLTSAGPAEENTSPNKRREIEARMTFGGTEISVTALDVATSNCVRSTIDFLNK